MSRDDPLLLALDGSVACQLDDLATEVLKDGRSEHAGALANLIRVSASLVHRV